MTREEFNEKMTDELVAKIKEKYVAAGAVDALILTKLIEDIHHFRGDNKYIVFYDKKIGLDAANAFHSGFYDVYSATDDRDVRERMWDVYGDELENEETDFESVVENYFSVAFYIKVYVRVAKEVVSELRGNKMKYVSKKGE